MSRGARIVLAFVLASCVAGCGAVRFQRAWSGWEPPAEGTGSASPLDGRWRGEWRSAWNGHSGGLRCLLLSSEAPDRVRAWFYSTYARILFFQYETELSVERGDDGRVWFQGEQELGTAVGGVYRYDGVVDGDRFHAHFRAENGDHGVFEMRRVE